jgi:hypothetical protein
MQTEIRRERWPGGQVKGVALVYPGQEVSPDQPVLRIEHKPLEQMVPAGLHGRVITVTRRGGVVIESRAAVLQGRIGAGNQVAGVLTMWQAGISDGSQVAIPSRAILVVPGPLNFALVRLALRFDVVGIIASSMTINHLEGFLHTDLLQLIGSENVEQAQAYLPPITLLLTEGLGALAMSQHALNLLQQYHGSSALLSGVTSVRKGIFPELIISLPLKETLQNWQPVQPDPTLLLGAQVRVCSGMHEGVIGIIDYLFTYELVFAGGVRARALRLHLENGAKLVLPITLVERIS